MPSFLKINQWFKSYCGIDTPSHGHVYLFILCRRKWMLTECMNTGFILLSVSCYLTMLLVSGCVVYQWDPTTHNVLNKLDCSKLVPCSESLKSISIEEHLSPGKCQVCMYMCVCACARTRSHAHACIYIKYVEPIS
jgi:hypothetical protein